MVNVTGHLGHNSYLSNYKEKKGHDLGRISHIKFHIFPYELQVKNTMCMCLLRRTGKNQKTPKH